MLQSRMFGELFNLVVVAPEMPEASRLKSKAAWICISKGACEVQPIDAESCLLGADFVNFCTFFPVLA